MNFSLKLKMIAIVLLALGFLLSGYAEQNKTMRRFGRLAMIQPEKIEEYKELHAAVWPHVLEELRKCNIHNYSIYLKDLGEAKPCLFAYFDYTGDDFHADTTKMSANTNVRKWKDRVDGKCLPDLLPDPENKWWVDMEEVFYFTGKTDVTVDESKVQRYGTVIGLKPAMVESYKLLHKYTWPEVLHAIEKGNIRNYSIYLHKLKDKYYLFSYFEYVGVNFEADMAMIDNHPASIAWMKFTDKGCQIPIPTRAKGEWWADMEEVFHCN